MEWKKVKIGDITKSLNGRRKPLNDLQRKSMKKGDVLYPYYGANNIVDYIDEYVFDEKILCVAEDGGSWGHLEKCSYIVNQKCWVNNHAHVLVPKDGKVLLEYLFFYLNYADLSASITGSTRGKLNKKSLENIKIPLPPMEVQIKIASALDQAQELINSRKAQIEKYDELLQSVFMDMFGDPVTNPKGWEIKKLEEIASKEKNAIVDGPFGASLKQDNYVEDGIPVIRINNIKPLGFQEKNFKYINEDKYLELTRSKVSYGDILIARVGHTIGKSCIFNKKYKALLSTTGVCKVTCDPTLTNNLYLWKLMNMSTFQTYILSNTAGSGQPYFNLKIIKGFKVILPPLHLQNQFASIVEKVEEEKKLLEESLVQMEDNFNSIMQMAFRGELF